MTTESTTNLQSRLRRLPSVDRLLGQSGIVELIEEYGRERTVESLRMVMDDVRREILDGGDIPELPALIARAAQHLAERWRASLRPVINATGIIIHTNLGRAPLADEAIASARRIAEGYSNLEYDLGAGERGSRYSHVSGLLARLTGAEAALVVNNNASAVLLALASLARGKQVLVSRGEAVEIGGGFRIPDVMRQSGAKLVEVGTTNRTYARDYEEQITPQTALLLRVHSSNFRVVGFTHTPELVELGEISRRTGVPLMDDLGSGSLLDTAAYGLAREPMVQESIAAGSALVCFSGDKLLGGPQAGLIVGKTEILAKLRRHPLARAVRVDKVTLAALEATLLLYARGEAETRIPVWRMIAAKPDDLRERAMRWRSLLEPVPPSLELEVIAGESAVGGGSLPGETLPTYLLSLRLPGRSRGAVDRMAAHLRDGATPVVARVEHGALLLDPRTVAPREEDALLDALQHALEQSNW